MPRHKKSELVKIQDLKSGDKFYDWDGIICKFIDGIQTPNNFQYCCKILKFNITEARSIYTGSGDIEFYRYSGRRDRSSFNAGFKHALKICMAQMNSTDLLNAGLEDNIKEYMTMLREYEKWIRNVERL